MTDRDSAQPERLDELLAAFAEEGLSAEQEKQLAALLKDDPAAREQFASYVAVHAWLEWDQSEPAEFALPAQASPAHVPSRTEAAKREDDETPAEETAESSSSPVTPQRSRSTWGYYLTQHNMGVGMAAGLLFVVGLLTWAAVTYLPDLTHKDKQSDNKMKYVAVLNGRHNVAWLDGTEPAPHRPRLVTGQRLAIASGFLDIRYRHRCQGCD